MQVRLLLQEIVTTNTVLRECLEQGMAPYKMVEAWDQVQLQTATLLNADQPGLQAGAGHAPGKPMRCDASSLRNIQTTAAQPGVRACTPAATLTSSSDDSLIRNASMGVLSQHGFSYECPCKDGIFGKQGCMLSTSRLLTMQDHLYPGSALLSHITQSIRKSNYQWQHLPV